MSHKIESIDSNETKDSILNDPLEELLGSMSCSDTDGVEGKTRTSARVFKKMRFDSVQQEKKAEKKEEVKVEENKVEIKRCLSTFWTPEEKNIFFEAVNEFGKDFESIHSYLSARLKKKGMSEDLIKTKYQVRNFYYKTFHHVINYVKFSEKVPKHTQELYSVINFGEMRRRVGIINKKLRMKMTELTYHGSITLKHKGKTIRIKTPMCKALRRLNKLDEKYDDLKLPTRVLVELRPRNVAAFLRVQSIAQNPRIRIAMSLQKRVSTLITCISARWKTSEALVYDKAIISTNPTTKDCVPDQKQIDEDLKHLNPYLRLCPSNDANIELPVIDISEYFTGQSISLNAYETRIGPKPDVKKEGNLDVKVEKNSLQTEDGTQPDNFVDDAVNTILMLKKQDGNKKVHIKQEDSKELEEKRIQIEKIKEGWTLETCGSLTIGEIYLMLGANSKVMLEYSWNDPPPPPPSNDISTKFFKDTSSQNNLSYSLKKLLSLAKLQNKKSQEVKCNCSSKQFKKPLAPPKASHPVEKNDVDRGNAVDNAKIQKKLQQLSNDCFMQTQNNGMLTLCTKLNKFRNKCGGRFRSKQLVVERNLVPTKTENNHQIVTMNIVTQEHKPNEEEHIVNVDDDKKTNDVNSVETNTTKPSENDDTNDSRSFSGLLSGAASPLPCGLSKILKENENQWINNDVNDYSLSSLLGHLDGTSQKTNQSTSAIDESQLSQDVDAQLNKLLMETSIDFTDKFADLAAQVVDNKN